MPTTQQEFLSKGTGNRPPEEPRRDRELPFAVGIPNPDDPDHPKDPNDPSLGLDVGT